MDDLNKNKYKILNNFLTDNELEICKKYLIKAHRKSIEFAQDNVNLDTGMYNDNLLDTIIEIKKPLVEKVTGLTLLKTYAFCRVYTYQSNMHKHKDRTACEYSVTVHVDSDKPDWPLFLGGTPIAIKPGDAIIYKGREIEHWRETYHGDYHIQFFLHYVNKNGPFYLQENDSFIDEDR